MKEYGLFVTENELKTWELIAKASDMTFVRTTNLGPIYVIVLSGTEEQFTELLKRLNSELTRLY